MKRVGRHLRGNLVAYLALFCALGLGTAYAVERNSIEGKHIAKGAVRSSDIRDGAVAPGDQGEVPAIRLFDPFPCAGPSVPSGANARIAWAERDFTTGNLGVFGPCFQPGGGVVQVDVPGIYLITANLVWNSENADGTRSLRIYRTDSPSPLADSSIGASASFAGHSVSEVAQLDANDEVYAEAYQSSGTDLGLAQGDFSVVWLGPTP
jgi:hypothetical protein